MGSPVNSDMESDISETAGGPDLTRLERIEDWLGINTTTRISERWTAALGAFLAILAVFGASGWALGEENLVVATSMGSSAVLLFSVPHSALSQPWPLVGGHVCSALVGVACAMFLGTSFLSAGLAVGVAVLIMQLTRCTHPPAGATALAAVIGGDAVTDLGWFFVLKPVLLNALLLLLAALLFNWPRRSHWYPARFAQRSRRKSS